MYSSKNKYDAFYSRMHQIIKNSNFDCYVHYETKHSYQEMYCNICKLNTTLEKFKNKKIAVISEKSFEAYCSIYAILLTGNSWIPISHALPLNRVAGMIDLSEPDLVLFDEKLDKKITDYFVSKNIPLMNLLDLLKANEQTELELPSFDKDQIAYIMFTSGSSGTPKGVPMTHENYINFIDNAMEIFPFKKGEVFSDYHDFGFDISIFYLFCCILTESAFAPARKTSEQIFFVDNLLKNKVTVWASIPSALLRLKTLNKNRIANFPVKIMFMCGEPFRLDLLEYAFKGLGVQHVYNFYGLTETGVENYYHKCSLDDLETYKNETAVPIGRPLPGNATMVSDDGELLLHGIQITPGYLGGISGEKFLTIDGKRWFRTGDRVEKVGDVHFCKGRIDSQLKHRGYRVDLMDIESNIRKLSTVLEVICFQITSPLRDIIVAAVKAETKIDLPMIKTHLKELLPDYMHPDSVFPISEMPLNKSGKIDRIAIKRMYETNS